MKTYCPRCEKARRISEGFDSDLEGFVYTIRAGKVIVKVRKQPLIEVSISASNVAYKLWVHYDRSPVSVAVDSRVLPKAKDKAGYNAAKEGWYYGAGCFYGSDDIKTVNIKIPKNSKSQLVRITK